MPVRRCPEHGYLDGEACDCGREGVGILDDDRRLRISKFLSGVLRHFPDDAGVTLDRNGWASYGEVVTAVTERYDSACSEEVDAVVSTDPKGRFDRDGGDIRAAYGHSVEVSLDDADGGTPGRLYHGTARGNVEPILEEGIAPVGRNEVYLSETVDEARKVGERHGDPVVFEVDATGLEAVERGDGVYAVETVPPDALSLVQEFA